MLRIGNGSNNGGFPALTQHGNNGRSSSDNNFDGGSSNGAVYGHAGRPTVTDVDDDGESFVFGSSGPQSDPDTGRRGIGVASNPHRGGGMEPEEENSDRSRNSSGSENPLGRSVGSIDVRPKPKADPEPENFYDATSHHTSPEGFVSAASRSQDNIRGHGFGDSGYSGDYGASDPSPAYARPSYSSYLEELDGLDDDEPMSHMDVPTGPTPRQPGVYVPPPPEKLDALNTKIPGLPIPRNSSNHSGLSPLHENISGEETSPTESGSPKEAPFAPQVPISRGSRSSRSRQMGSRKSSTRSNLTGGPSTSTASGALSAVLTVDGSDSSGTDPPPTISDGSSSKSSLSGFSRELGGNNNGGNNDRGRGRASPYEVHAQQDQAMPPAPPFQRNVNADMYDDVSTSTPSAPMRTISKFGDSDTIVSDPTLDPSLFPPQASPLNQNSGSASRASNNSSFFNKKCSDETHYKNYQRTSSDENPSSKSASEAGEVDNIVAAALAYAERTHGDDSGGRSGSNQRSRSRSTGRRSGSAGKRRPSNFTEGDASSSIHSFYTEDEGGGGRASASQSTGNPRYTGPGAAAPVDDLVAQALSHAQNRFGSGLSASGKSRGASFHGSNPQAHSGSFESKKGTASFHATSSNNDSGGAQGGGAQGGGAQAFRSGAMANQKTNFKSEYSAWNKSVMSMYSEATEDESMGDQYDC